MKMSHSAKVLIVLIMAAFCYQPVSIQGDYNEQTCPLSRFNIKMAEDLLNRVNDLLEEVGEYYYDTSDAEAMIVEAAELLERADISSRQGQNCIAGNGFAVRAMRLLEKVIEMLESMLVTFQTEEYAVYSSLIDTGFDLIEYTYSRYEVQLLVIIDHTAGSDSGAEDINKILQWVSQEIPAVQEETLKNFLVKNTEPHPLGDFFILNQPIIFICEEEAQEVFQRNNGWEEFYEKYPFSQGIMTLSRVGFNSKMNQALVYVENRVHCSIGVGYYVLLTKENGVWTIQNWVTKWVA